MKSLEDGQCGLCTHFGEHHAHDDKLVQVRVNHEAPEDLVDDCGHPKFEGLHLRVSAISGCDGFQPAAAA